LPVLMTFFLGWLRKERKSKAYSTPAVGHSGCLRKASGRVDKKHWQSW
jgi:hypothetical protein